MIKIYPLFNLVRELIDTSRFLSKRKGLTFSLFLLIFFGSINQLSAQVKVELGASVGAQRYGAPFRTWLLSQSYDSKNALLGGYSFGGIPGSEKTYNFDIRLKKNKNTFSFGYSFGDNLLNGRTFGPEGPFLPDISPDLLPYVNIVVPQEREMFRTNSIEIAYHRDLISIFKRKKLPLILNGGIGLNHYTLKEDKSAPESWEVFPSSALIKNRVLLVTKAELRWWYLKASVEYSPFASQIVNDSLAKVDVTEVRTEKEGQIKARLFAFRFGLQVPILTIGKKAKDN